MATWILSRSKLAVDKDRIERQQRALERGESIENVNVNDRSAGAGSSSSGALKSVSINEDAQLARDRSRSAERERLLLEAREMTVDEQRVRGGAGGRYGGRPDNSPSAQSYQQSQTVEFLHEHSVAAASQRE